MAPTSSRIQTIRSFIKYVHASIIWYHNQDFAVKGSASLQ